MIIHVVQEGETIYSIADMFGISAERLIQDNQILTPDNLVTGQSIVITFPEQTYSVQEGDTLYNIANAFGISVLQLLRNNPFLSDREFIYPGDTLIISYGDKIRSIQTHGYCNDFINRSILRKTLPYLTYLSIFGYRIIEGGEIEQIDDTDIIAQAYEYNVAPLMFLSTISERGEENFHVDFNILNNEHLMDTLISNILNIIKEKNYYGLNITYRYISAETLQKYELLNTKLTRQLKSEGYPVFITISPNQIRQGDLITFEKIDYSVLGQEADGIMILSYKWGYTYGFPGPITSIDETRKFLDYIITQVPAEKILVGQPLISYDWTLPYTIGVTKANSLTLQSTLVLAQQVGAIIQFDETSQTPYFVYVDQTKSGPTNHVVWFVDSRTINSLLELIDEYNLQGTGIWNIMQYYSQLWLVTNSQYDIESIIY
ncbi:glycoside hydrolase family 18 protein [Mobilitalea sibirica]|uniref:Glycoside hydrolase family 18 protein n=1 Tax=Mobilitalea sibirica TaxID=1462919 RepID=A0A8J7KWC0_9FIRM|nr:LysM peptidoglycan-binding domain-containing protein [Mobilitalea sibirica]MBH1940227.1 glycoside hydrolase family 18 protein [Mobilitalea sibirica]